MLSGQLRPMGTVLQLRKRLDSQPDFVANPGMQLRNFQGSEDCQIWLDLRSMCFANLIPSPQPWSEKDFRREFLSKSWWSAKALWFATTLQDRDDMVVGSMTLAPGNPCRLQWLMVRPDFRRQGVGSALVAAAEKSCWEFGGREIILETLDQWTAATCLYRSLGYS